LNSENSGRKLRLLWHSVAPWIASGYGKVTKEICTRLTKYGFDVIVSAYYGVEPGGIPIYQIPVLPAKEGRFGITSAAKYYRQFKVDYGFLFSDWWAFEEFPKAIPKPILYGPMDQINYPPELTALLKNYLKIISLCKWQQDRLTDLKMESDIIYHGVNTKLYKPVSKKEARKRFNIEENAFVFGTVGANNDKEDRKCHTRSMKAMRYFLDQNPDVKDIKWLYHTNPSDPNGLPLFSFARKLKLDRMITFMDPSVASIMMTEEDMALLMNCFDVHILCSKREGFGLPILETQACGVPNICHDFSSMTELVKGHGWLCKSISCGLNAETTPIAGESAVPDVYDIADCIKQAYFHTDTLKKYGYDSRGFSLSFDWDMIVENKWIPYLEKLSNGNNREIK
jgi:glycosyltransferase involved in cell wall biosynthesis